MPRPKKVKMGRKPKIKKDFTKDLSYLKDLPVAEYQPELCKIFTELSDYSKDDFKKELDDYVDSNELSEDIKKAPSHSVMTLGKLCWIINRGGVLSEKHHEDFVKRLNETQKLHSVKIPKKKAIPPEEKIEQVKSKHISYHWLSKLDECLDKNNTGIDLSKTVTDSLTIEEVKEVVEVFTGYLNEFKTCLVDDELRQCYGSRLGLQRKIRFVESVLSFSQTYIIENTKNTQERKTRGLVKKKTDVSTGQKAAQFKYLAKYQDIVSVPPLRVIGKHCVVALNTKTSNIIILRGNDLDLQGSYIVGINEKETFIKRIPAKKIHECMHIVHHCKSLKKIEGYLQTLSGRIIDKETLRFTNDTIILNVFNLKGETL